MIKTLPILLGAVVAVSAVLPSVADAKVSAAQKEKAAILSVAAHDALGKGDFKMAAKLYDSAFSSDPDTVGYLYSAARARQRAGQLEQAEAQFRACIEAIGDKDDELSRKAQQRLVEVQTARSKLLQKKLQEEQQARKEAEARLAAQKEAARIAEQTRQEDAARAKAQQLAAQRARANQPLLSPTALGYGAIGAGGVLVGIGVGLAISNWLAWADARDQNMPTDAGKPPPGKLLTYDQAEKFASDTNTSLAVNLGVAAVGGVALGYGIAKLLGRKKAEKSGDEARLSLVPAGRGVRVQVAF